MGTLTSTTTSDLEVSESFPLPMAHLLRSHALLTYFKTNSGRQSHGGGSHGVLMLVVVTVERM